MKILITGASGFLGHKILSYFKGKATIKLLGRNDSSDYKYNLATHIPNLDQAFDIVIHCAGKAHTVPESEIEVSDFYRINYNGTVNLLSALEKNPPKSFIFISSVAVYGLESGDNITEDYPLNASDPYGKSKILAESAVQQWCFEKKVSCIILRLPLIVGSNAPGNLSAMINGIKKGYYFNISKCTAKRSMVFVDDIPIAIEKMIGCNGIFNLTDGYHPTFYELSNKLALELGKKKVFLMPIFFAKFLAKIGDVCGNKFPINSHKLRKLTSNLTFDDAKARGAFGWNPSFVLDSLNIVNNDATF